MRSDAQENRIRLIRATRDVVGWAGSTDVPVRRIASTAGVSTATLYRHFDSKQDLVDGVSIARWSRMLDLARERGPDEEPIHHVLRVLDAYSHMTTRDHLFIRGANLVLGASPVEHIRADFEPYFADSWVDAQASGHIRKTANPRDAIDMTGVIRDPNRRRAMLAVLFGGICTDRVDFTKLASGGPASA